MDCWISVLDVEVEDVIDISRAFRLDLSAAENFSLAGAAAAKGALIKWFEDRSSEEPFCWEGLSSAGMLKSPYAGSISISMLRNPIEPPKTW